MCKFSNGHLDYCDLIIFFRRFSGVWKFVNRSYLQNLVFVSSITFPCNIPLIYARFSDPLRFYWSLLCVRRRKFNAFWFYVLKKKKLVTQRCATPHYDSWFLYPSQRTDEITDTFLLDENFLFEYRDIDTSVNIWVL